MRIAPGGIPLAVARVAAVALSVGVAAWIVQRAHERANPEHLPLATPAPADGPDAPNTPATAADDPAAAPAPETPGSLSSSRTISDLGFSAAFPTSGPMAPTFILGSKSGDLSEVLAPAGPPVRPYLSSSKSMVIDPPPVERP